MAQNFSTKDFFRQMPNALLARYFQGKGLMADLDFAAMKQGKPDALFDAWLELPDPIRSKLDAELRDIHPMCSEKGWVSSRPCETPNPLFLNDFLANPDGHIRRDSI